MLVNFWNLFEDNNIYKGKAHVRAEIDVSDYYYEGSIPFITRTDSNNGCNGYVQKDMVEDIEKGNALIIGDTTSTCFYQKDDFITGGHIIIFSNF